MLRGGRLELGFHQQDQVALRTAHREQVVATVRSEMNDRSATTTSTAPPIDAGSNDRMFVRVVDRTARVAPQPFVQLSVAHVDGDDLLPRPAAGRSR